MPWQGNTPVTYSCSHILQHLIDLKWLCITYRNMYNLVRVSMQTYPQKQKGREKEGEGGREGGREMFRNLLIHILVTHLHFSLQFAVGDVGFPSRRTIQLNSLFPLLVANCSVVKGNKPW